MRILQLLFLVFTIFIACSDQEKRDTKRVITTPFKLTATMDSILSNDASFYGDSVFHSHKSLLFFMMKNYDSDTCVPMNYKKESLRKDFEGFKNIGDVNNDNKIDSVFILAPLNWCEYDLGESYYFTDSLLPRLPSGSNCCHPSNFFKAPDIDEDGIAEVGFYYSSCASRYKSLRIFKLRNKQWQKIAVGEFDVMTQDPSEVKLEDLVMKIAKNKFRVKNFLEGKIYWDTLLIKN